MMFNKGLIYSLKNVTASEYYKYQIYQKKRSQKDTLKKLIKYYLLFKSMKKHGFKVDNRKMETFPWLFASKNVRSRFDGHHRTSVARFLGYCEIPVLLITPRDILQLDNLPDDIASIFIKMENPDMKLYRPYEFETA